MDKIDKILNGIMVAITVALFLTITVFVFYEMFREREYNVDYIESVVEAH